MRKVCNPAKRASAGVAVFVGSRAPAFGDSIAAKDCELDGLDATASLQIEGVADRATVARAPNSPTPVRLSLRALGAAGRVVWMVNGRLQGETMGGRSFVHDYPDAGVQVVTAMAETGACTQVGFRVLR